MKAGQNKTLADYFIEGLKAGAAEIEELRVQIALGKMEAKDLYENEKKKFNERLNEIRFDLIALKASPDILKLINAAELVRMQLILGIADTEEAFEKQRKSISSALEELEMKITGEKKYAHYAQKFRMEIEKFKIKLELIALHYKLKKISTQFEFKERKAAFLDKINEVKRKIDKSKENMKDKLAHFEDELAEAYAHFRKAFSN